MGRICLCAVRVRSESAIGLRLAIFMLFVPSKVQIGDTNSRVPYTSVDTIQCMVMSFIDLLLPEILYGIFSSLHIEDRKAVRLVCKKWNDLCNWPAILRREKFVVRPGQSLESIELTLRNCKQVRKAIEFQGLSLDELSTDLWRIIGRNLSSLKLVNCTGTARKTKNIFIHCRKMRSFRFSPKYRSLRERDQLSKLFRSTALWDKLIRRCIHRRKLRNFHLYDVGLELPKDVLQKIFTIFPSIRNFGAGYSSYVKSNSEPEASLGNTFNPASMRVLTINVPCSGLWIQELSEVPELKLQRLEAALKDPTVSPDIFVQFLQNQRELKHLKIAIFLTTENEDYPRVILSKILSICTELVDFGFKMNATLKIDEFFRVLRAVSESKLEYFMIRFKPSYDVENLMIFHDYLSTYFPPLTNKRLRTLKLTTGIGLSEEYCLPMLQHFHGLRHLEITAVSDKVLQTIFKYHIHLQILVLRIVDRCTAFGFTGNESDSSVEQEKSYSISRLQELKYLEVEGSLDKLCLEKIMRLLNFPRLKYLRLNLWELKKEISLQFLPVMIPMVEVLIIDKVPLHVDEYLFLCQHMQRLRFLSCVSLKNREVIENLFVVRPSLKYVVDWTGNNYSYDRLSKTLSSVDFLPLELGKSFLSEDFRVYTN